MLHLPWNMWVPAHDVPGSQNFLNLMRSILTATGSFVPVNRESSASMEQRLGLEPGWIEQRTGVRFRAIAESDDAVSDLAVRAAKVAIAQFDADSNPEIGALLLATSTPDHLLPPTAPQVAHQLGLAVAAMDITVACCGFLYGLILADSIVRTRQTSVLVIGANILTRRCDPEDIATSAIFADGAGAVIMSRQDSESGILATAWSSDGSNSLSLQIPDGGSRSPFSATTYSESRHFMRIVEGSSIFKYAAKSMADMGLDVVSQAGLTVSDVDWWIPHQANRRIIEATRRLLDIAPEKTLVTVDEIGNSSAATIPVTLDRYLRIDQRIQRGDLVLMTAAAAGMTSSAVMMQIG